MLCADRRPDVFVLPATCLWLNWAPPGFCCMRALFLSIPWGSRGGGQSWGSWGEGVSRPEGAPLAQRPAQDGCLTQCSRAGRLPQPLWHLVLEYLALGGCWVFLCLLCACAWQSTCSRPTGQAPLPTACCVCLHPLALPGTPAAAAPQGRTPKSTQARGVPASDADCVLLLLRNKRCARLRDWFWSCAVAVMEWRLCAAPWLILVAHSLFWNSACSSITNADSILLL